MTGKKYADQYDYAHLWMAGRHQSLRHAVMALIQQVQVRPSGLPGGGTQGHDLRLNRAKELVHDEVEHHPPLEILTERRVIEQEILQGIKELEGMLR